MTASPFDAPFEALPRTLAVFPLPGALLLPQQQLPLNIFEPRYVSMVLDALGQGRHIGMIQPDATNGPEDPPALYRVGCAGRITTFQETDDGRILIGLTGVCRFQVVEEIEMANGYRRVVADWARFARDLAEPDEPPIDRAGFEAALRAYLDANGMRADWDELRKVQTSALVDLLSMKLPLAPPEKQALLEASDRVARSEILVASLQMGGSLGEGANGTVH